MQYTTVSSAFLFTVKKNLFMIFLILSCPAFVWGQDFYFLHLSFDGKSQQRPFSVLKDELSRRTSVVVDDNHYQMINERDLLDQDLPDIPYLWIVSCGSQIRDVRQTRLALLRFIQNGGMLVVDSCGYAKDQQFIDMLDSLGADISGDNYGVIALDDQHPINKSFFLVSHYEFEGANVSPSTKRTAMIINKQGLLQDLGDGDEIAIRTSVNIVMYLLSGNYKDDQIHTRQILNRIKKRELFK